ncbi:MAG: tRNA lysidine(34) synthetase TilS [Clostridiales bacterium]|jgi:tRNA(Ile)-lysidine synthase|nr:tRNA lysidine(34) synthetase TilS [Clostridiales bacterium]
MLNKVISTIEKYKLLAPGDRVLVGLSGGADSAALFCVLGQLRERCGISLAAAHINHMLRGDEADGDEAFVRELCARAGIPCEIYRVNVRETAERKGMSLEEAGRLIRYEAFEDASKKLRCVKTAVAHHMNDNAETIIMRILRGTGTSGLCGIRPNTALSVGGQIIRPFIEVTRREIEAFCATNNIAYRADSSNTDDAYRRNRVRKIIAGLEAECGGAVVKNICKMAIIINEENEFLEGLAQSAYENCLVSEPPGEIMLDRERLEALPNVIKHRVARIALGRLSAGRRDISKEHIDNALALLQKSTGKSINMPLGISAQRIYGALRFKRGEAQDQSESLVLTADKPAEWGQSGKWAMWSFEKKEFFNVNTYTKEFDYDKINGKGPLTLRAKCPGDRIYIKKIGGHKKISDYFTDEKIPRQERCIPLVAVGGDVLWILDRRGLCSDEYLADENTVKKIYVHVWEADDEANFRKFNLRARD